VLQQERDRFQHPGRQELVAIRPAAANRVWVRCLGVAAVERIWQLRQSRPDSGPNFQTQKSSNVCNCCLLGFGVWRVAVKTSLDFEVQGFEGQTGESEGEDKLINKLFFAQTLALNS